jgi:2-methylisocitrate lyase-like PEP mutase family enzyme
MINGYSYFNSLAQVGVARISYGPFSYISLMQNLEEAARKLYS